MKTITVLSIAILIASCDDYQPLFIAQGNEVGMDARLVGSWRSTDDGIKMDFYDFGRIEIVDYGESGYGSYCGEWSTAKDSVLAYGYKMIAYTFSLDSLHFDTGQHFRKLP